MNVAYMYGMSLMYISEWVYIVWYCFLKDTVDFLNSLIYCEIYFIIIYEFIVNWPH